MVAIPGAIAALLQANHEPLELLVCHHRECLCTGATAQGVFNKEGTPCHLTKCLLWDTSVNIRSCGIPRLVKKLESALKTTGYHLHKTRSLACLSLPEVLILNLDVSRTDRGHEV